MHKRVERKQRSYKKAKGCMLTDTALSLLEESKEKRKPRIG